MVTLKYNTSDRTLCFMGVPNAPVCILLVYALLTFGLVTEGTTAAGFESKTAFACEDSQLVLKCQVGEVIRILRANYGRFTISVCNRQGQTEGWNLQCMSPKAKDIISERCDGRRECDMRVGNHIFVDPCPLTSKYAEVKYSCHLAPIETPYIQTTLTAATQIQPQMPLNGSPRPPQITSVTALGPHQIEITWIQAEPPNPILTTAVYLKDIAMKTEPSPRYTNSEGTLIIDELRPNTSYSIFLKSFNINGPSLTSNTVNVTTSLLDEIFMITTTMRTDTANTDYSTAATKQSLFATKRLHPSANLDDTKRTVATPDQSTTLKPEFTSLDDYFPNFDPQSNDYSPNGDPSSNDYFPNVDPQSNDYSPNDPKIPIDKEANNDEYINGVVDKFCEETVNRGVVWPQTRFGRIVENNCPRHLRGAATWHCLDYGWEKTGPDLSDCSSAWVEKMDSQINKVMRGEEPADQAAVALNEAIVDQEFTSGDLKKASMKLLPKLAKGLQRDDPTMSRPNKRHRMKNFKKAFMSTSSDLLSKKNMQSWRSLSRQDRRRAATSLVLAIEDVGFHTASLMDIGTSEVTVDENIVMEVTVIDTQQNHDDITFPSKNDLLKTSWESLAVSDSITIRSTSLKVAGMRGPVNVVFTLYKNMEDLIQPQLSTITAVTGLSSSSDGDGYYSTGTLGDSNSLEGSGTSAVRVVSSKIIAASINSTKPKRKLTEPVMFTLEHLEPTNKGKPLCSFWDVDTSYLSGQWSQDGCRLIDTNTTHTTCECDHLTNFAILMDITGVKLTPENKLALRVITFVGCVISVICLTLSWITFLVFKNLQCDRNTIHRNLVLCLLLAEILFLGGISQTEPKIVCSIIAGILHYLFLCAFAWMCLEGVQLYIMLVEVFEQEKSRVLWYYLFGYGAPAIVVIISAAVHHEGYGTDKHCWLTTDNNFIWSFVGPALAVMLINTGMLSIAIYTMCRHSIMSITMRERSKATKFRSWVKGAVVLVVLLGLTWLLGVLYLNEESVVIAYFFTVLNSLQGLFIFVFHCLKNEKVQKEYRKVVRRTSWMPDCIRVNYGGYSGMSSSSQVGSSDSRNYLSKLFAQKRTEQSAVSTSSSTKPFLTKDQQRRSETENSASKESCNIPASLNGYVYNPSYTINGNRSAKIPFLSTDHGEVKKVAENRHVVGDNGYDAMAVSEFNMQVQGEECRYSVASDENNGEKPEISFKSVQMDNQSVASNSRKPPFNTSSDRSLGGQDKDHEIIQTEEPLDHRLNLHQYVIPASRQNSNTEIDLKNISGKPQRADNLSTSKNKINNPYSSHSSIPEVVTSPHLPDSPDLPFRQDFTEPTLTSSDINSPESDYMTQTTSEPVYEEVNVNFDSSASSKSSLSNLN